MAEAEAVQGALALGTVGPAHGNQCVQTSAQLVIQGCGGASAETVRGVDSYSSRHKCSGDVRPRSSQSAPWGHGLAPAPTEDPQRILWQTREDGIATVILPGLLTGAKLGTQQILVPSVVWVCWIVLVYHRKRSKEVFSRYGLISDVFVVYDQVSRRSIGICLCILWKCRWCQGSNKACKRNGARWTEDHSWFLYNKRPHTPTLGIYTG